MSFPVTENIAKSQRHISFYLACGMPEATPIIFLHGWPELSVSWRHQLPAFGNLGFRPSRQICVVMDARASIRAIRTMPLSKSSLT